MTKMSTAKSAASRRLEVCCMQTCATCPDISQAVGPLPLYTSNPGVQHWCSMQRVLRYVNGTI